MRNELTVFENEKFGKVRVVTENEKPYFNLNDVCEILGLKNPRQVKSRLNPKGVILVDTLTSGGKQQMNFINESNLYKCIFQSDKPEAEAITEWVTGEVLPTIRKTGMYVTDELLNNPDLAIKAFTRLKEEQEKRMRLEKEIEEQAPAVAFANSLTVSKDCILVRELSKILKQNGIDVGETRLFEWLRQNGYLISKVGSDWNLPTQKSMNLGLFVIKEGTRMSTTEGSKITKTPKVTGKGQQYFLNKFLKNNRLMEVN
ncbi:phage antirepressor Ant [Leptotrichia hofstadii]|uniref:Phage antirepressor protein n=1 Tax=Leptotrichia hofstadii F0254 TaxID=634994 RepID=C9MV70_9FUSO|nr:phage antirepressor Ant [Leptotrichia hofstadii]EEX75292.1 phage antirepressor protein [Leptotrichia hofstadii F0254]